MAKATAQSVSRRGSVRGVWVERTNRAGDVLKAFVPQQEWDRRGSQWRKSWTLSKSAPEPKGAKKAAPEPGGGVEA